MAATLTAAGLFLVRPRDRWAGRFRGYQTLVLRVAGALLVLVGLGLAGRALIAVG